MTTASPFHPRDGVDDPTREPLVVEPIIDAPIIDPVIIPDIDPALYRHDLLAPLRAIDALSEFAIEDLDSCNHEQARQNIARIHDSVATARALLQGVDRFEKAANLHAVESTDLPRLLRSIVADLEIGPKLTTVVATDELGEQSTVYIHRAALKTCVSEIVKNAVAHRTRERGAVVVAASIIDSELSIRVADDGAGIKPEHWNVVFEPLRKIQVGDTRGVGLGLSTAARSALAHGGSVRILSSSDSGSEFEIRWPISRPQRRRALSDN